MIEELIRLHNETRAAYDLAPLTENAELRRCAEIHAKWMRNRGRMTHGNFARRLGHSGYRYKAAGENIAAGQRTPEAAVRAWLISRGHRRNMMGDFFHIGAAVSGFYWCVIFGTPGNTSKQACYLPPGIA